MKPTQKFHLLASSLLILSLACSFSAVVPATSQANPSAFNTQVAQTLAAQNAVNGAVNTAIAQTAAAAAPLQFGGGATSAPPTVAPPAQAMSDEQSIKQALLTQLGWSDAQIQFALTASDGRVAHGTVAQTGQAGGAAWFAAKDSSGQWVIVHTGQSWPLCSAIQPYDFPASYISNCEESSGQIVDRTAGQNPPPSNPPAGAPTQADVYPPNPLGAAWTGFWIEPGGCYDLDQMITVNTAACDLKLDAANTFIPQNGALFDAAPLQYVPSLNVCKAATLGDASFDANFVTYVCFKTNAGKYGFFIPREILAEGILFDAYVFP